MRLNHKSRKHFFFEQFERDFWERKFAQKIMSKLKKREGKEKHPQVSHRFNKTKSNPFAIFTTLVKTQNDGKNYSIMKNT